MKRTFILLLVIVGTSISRPFAQTGSGHKNALTLYKEAVRLFNLPKPTKQTDSLTMRVLLRVVGTVQANRKNAPVLFDCFEKIGVIKQVYELQPEAIAFYQKAIALCLRYKLPDSLLFKPYLRCGSAYYSRHSFDSSTYYLKKAETIFLKHPASPDAHDLYNSFGAIYYEAGNYQQSINYFQKAVQISQRVESLNKTYYLHSFKTNIASALRQLERYDAAVSMYKSMIPLDVSRNALFINLGMTYLEKAEPDSALHYLVRVNKADRYNPIILENSLGHAYLQKKRINDAFTHLNRALLLNQKNQVRGRPPQKNNHTGLTYKLLADGEQKRHNLKKALHYYQQSIIQLDNNFNDTVIYHNPSDVTAGFRSYLLFESLASKATCLQKLHEQEPTAKSLTSTIRTYESTLKLAEYIEKSFDTEDAQLFIVRKVFPVYQQAVTFLIYAFEQTNNKAYLERAFGWAEKSKAATLYINLKDSQIKSYTGISDSLLTKERNLKFNQSRLFLRMDRAATNAEVAVLTSEMRDNDLALSRLADKLNEYPNYHRKKFGFDSINVADLQHKLIDSHTAIVSYFQTNDAVYCFVLTNRGVRYHASRRDDPYNRALRTINAELRTSIPGTAYRGGAHARLLYDRLIKPVSKELAGIRSLIIIPHNELTLLPFEVLEDANRAYLLETFDVTYQYAASFLQHQNRQTIEWQNMLAVAPFDSINRTSKAALARLPASDREIAGLTGVKLTHRVATKENFIKRIANASVIHLATHAVANSDDPSRSYIAFYPTGNNDDRLYAHELRNAPLSNVQLIFLSACETAGGKLINGEGVMSLSRALSYAGCPNLITSLWKAEDNATAYLSIQFYTHLQKGYTVAESLRRAKIDLIRDGRYAQYHSPQYWSHLVFIGAPNPSRNYAYLWLLAGAVILAGLFTGWWLHRRHESVSQSVVTSK